MGYKLKTWLFWYEDGSDYTFKIEAIDYKDAYDKAYDAHGPQVKDMMYKWV